MAEVVQELRSRLHELRIRCDERSDRAGDRDRQAQRGIKTAWQHLANAEESLRRRDRASARDSLAHADAALALTLTAREALAAARRLVGEVRHWDADGAAAVQSALEGIQKLELADRRVCVREAMLAKQEVESGRARGQDNKDRMMLRISGILSLSMALLLLAAALRLFDVPDVGTRQGSFLVVVVVCGGLSGAVSSALLAVSVDRRAGRGARWDGPWLRLRPLIGAGAGLVLALLVASGLLDIPDVQRTTYYGIAAVGGFSEEFLERAVRGLGLRLLPGPAARPS